MKNVLKKLQKIEDLLIVVTFVIMVLASFAQVVNRNIVHAGISWFEELARYCMVYMALLAAEMGLRDGTQISVTVFTDSLKGKPKKIVAIIAKVIIIIFAAVAFVSSFTILRTQVSSGQISPGLKLPMYVPYFALPLSFGITVMTQSFALFQLITGKEPNGEVQA